MTAAIDLVCWDFGDTLCDERFMRIPPDEVPQWTAVYDGVVDAHPAWVADWMLGRASLNDLIAPLAEKLPMSRAAIARHLRAVWRRIAWFPEARAWLERLDGAVPQAVVTVNPWEFAGIAAACGLDRHVDVIVTSAEIASESKVAMALRARELLALSGDLSTTLLIDNRSDNVDEFVGAGALAIRYEPGTFEREAARLLGPLLAP
ncbi:MAG: hypothetical protein QNJ12_00505 [Ilumatobacter sp.]|uniref:HAD family hydrolase n=1 Tax=Ilumatobacter sp. TaxID=1967498 RepID=UPI00262219A9|nr:hypothetical protein [Ilumatobacter sp.]MDJ0767232.1 hypothetical protein [Ilumatobacter sp.]